jgi:predicted Zn-dependent protease with MMP-like domain
MSKDHWNHLCRLARLECDVALAALPAEVRAKAAEVPILFEPQPTAAMIEDGLDGDLLGLFTGEDFSSGGSTIQPLPPQIFLFLENLWDFSEGDEEIFLDEVTITLLHELGHYLGWDELDLESRGLE